MQEMQPMLYFKKERIMRKKTLALFLTCVLAAGMFAGCGNKDSKDNNQVENSQGTESAKDDQAAADEVAELIDAIYVQTRNENTDEQCAAAKAAWDKLTDAQKALVSGENADPDYFGRDTGDASKDDPLNQDNIGDNEILVVSFGTSFNDSRVADISGVEKAIQAANPDWAVRRAFTAQIIINHVQARDGEKIDNVDQALQRAVDNGVKNLVIQPTHLMHGAEYDELVGELDAYKDKFEKVVVAEPLLGEVGDDATVINDDKKAVAEDITAEAVKTAGYDSLDAAKKDGTAFVFMGHGTSHSAKVSYSQMSTQMDKLGYDNVFIGTVEGEPEETSCENVIKAVKDAGYKKVILRPLMVVAGDHANNDMAGDDDDSWKSQFTASGNFDSVDTQIAGLGEIEAVQKLYVEHTKKAKNREKGKRMKLFNKYKFSDKSQTLGGTISTVMGVAALSCPLYGVFVAFKKSGEAGLEVGSLGLMALMLSVIGTVIGLLSFKEYDKFYTLSKICSMLCGIIVVFMMAVFVMGLGF